MNRTPGFGLLCDDDGYVVEVLYNSLDYEIEISAGMLFSSLAAPGSLAKFLSFMVEVRAFGAAFDWEVNIQTKHGLKPIRLVGGSLGGNYFSQGRMTPKQRANCMKSSSASTMSKQTPCEKPLKKILTTARCMMRSAG